ncbi:MAG: bifunctional folylpolyglutamate synthase/dihydrofolate synthase [Candidatus Hydrogenedens sp.]|nr:bifunctional folylpolyglutamate synthase/dihydrofolate synthase [Candidatus Hydrogenedens sp.]
MDIFSTNLPNDDIAFLHSLVLHGVKLGLDSITTLLKHVGEPHKKFLSLHIGGTNGKGSTVAYLDRILREQGFRVGKFTSPHLINLSERFQVNGVPIPPEELHDQIEFFRTLTTTVGICPTFFEFCTAIAFHWFAQQKVDWAIIEVGMGGRLDSTNVIYPEVSAITNIALEHTQYLGDTLEKIAWEKAGIIKEGVPIVTAETKYEPFKVIQKQAEELKAPLWQIEKDFHIQWEKTENFPKLNYYSSVRKIEGAVSGLCASYQRENAGVALAMIDWLQLRGFSIKEEAILHGLANVRWPGRFDLVSQSPWVLLDSAHNPDGMKQIVKEVNNVVVILTVADDKDIGGIVQTLAPITKKFIVTQFYGKRAMIVEDIVENIIPTGVPYIVEKDFHSALKYGWERALQKDKLLITGSIYAVGQTYQWLIENGIINKIEF